MAAIDVLTMLAPHGVVVGSAGGGGWGRLTAQDVCSMMAGAKLSRMQELAVRARVLDDEKAIKELHHRAVVMVAGMAIEDGWRGSVTKASPRLYAIAARAVLDLLGNRTCRRCSGTGQRGSLPCDACEGLGASALMIVCGACGGRRLALKARATKCRECDASPDGCALCDEGWRSGLVPCEECRGRGEVRVTDRQMAELLGVSAQGYSKTWAPRVAKACARLAAEFWDAEGRMMAYRARMAREGR
ncbi:MAG: hypothetical protein ACU85V_00250 [Gammaproteobacteria bacterium]